MKVCFAYSQFTGVVCGVYATSEIVVAESVALLSQGVHFRKLRDDDYERERAALAPHGRRLSPWYDFDVAEIKDYYAVGVMRHGELRRGE